MMGFGVALLIIGTVLFHAVRPDKNDGSVLEWPIFALIMSGSGLIVASICTWLYRVMP